MGSTHHGKTATVRQYLEASTLQQQHAVKKVKTAALHTTTVLCAEGKTPCTHWQSTAVRYCVRCRCRATAHVTAHLYNAATH